MRVSWVGSTESVNAEPAPALLAVAKAVTAAIVSVHQWTVPSLVFIWPPAITRGGAEPPLESSNLDRNLAPDLEGRRGAAPRMFLL